MSSERAFDIQEDKNFQEKFWKAERVAWVAFGLLMIAGALGFLGSGGLFARAVVKAGESSVDYPRVARWQTGAQITVSFGPSPLGERKVGLSRSFAEAFSLDDAQPRPIRAETAAAGELLVFAVKAGEPAEVTIRIKPSRPGLAQSVLTIDDAPASTSIVVLP